MRYFIGTSTLQFVLQFVIKQPYATVEAEIRKKTKALLGRKNSCFLKVVPDILRLLFLLVLLLTYIS